MNDTQTEQTLDITTDPSWVLGYTLAGQSGWNSRGEALYFAKSNGPVKVKEFNAGWNRRKGVK
jgi:hypothetical protein